MPNSLQAQVSSVLLKSFCLLALLARGLKRELQSQEKIPRTPPNMGHSLKSFLRREAISTQPISARCPSRLSVHRHLSNRVTALSAQKAATRQMLTQEQQPGLHHYLKYSPADPCNRAGGGQGPPRVTLVMEGFMTLYGSG